MSAAISSAGLTKTFGALDAVDDVDLDVPPGSIYGFLGPNGSGKTTTIRMLLGLVRPTSGTHSLFGDTFEHNGVKALERIGALIEGPAFHPFLSGHANLARLDAADRTADAETAEHRIGAALERVGLSAAAAKRYRAYSLGMRQRLGIAAAVLRPRDLLILDEPTNGLDPQGTREVRTLITELAASGVTVFLSSHLLGEVDQVCTDVGVMSAGRLIWQGALDDLRATQEQRVRIDTDQVRDAEQVLRSAGLRDIIAGPGRVTAPLRDVQPERLVEALVAAGVGVRGFVVERQGLEDTFVGLTGAGFDVAG